MSAPVLATKLYIPPARPAAVLRPRLIERLNEGLSSGRKLTLISAPAGFGKTTLLSEWIHQKDEGRRREDEGGRARPERSEGMKDESGKTLHASSFIPDPSKVAWLSLDEGDNDLTRFLTYFIAALQTLALSKTEGLALSEAEGLALSKAEGLALSKAEGLALSEAEGLAPSEAEGLAPKIGEGVLAMLQSPQPHSTESILTALINEITTNPDHFILVLDDYHVIDAQPVDDALVFLIEHLPPQMHLVIATREDPPLPLARYRARGQLTELRLADLRFTPAEAAEFLNQVMNLDLSADDIAALETRTEGWIAGLQLAAISMRGSPDTAGFIKSFTGSHHFVLDYLMEEVLQQLSETIQTFLLHTSILNRLCGPLCEAVLRATAGSDQDTAGQETGGQLTLEYLERANLFIVPLDNERRWYRYHHLFGDILRQRLGQRLSPAEIAEFHLRASQWYELNGDEAEAFHHAIAAGDFGRAAGLAELAWQGMNATFQSAAWLGWVVKLPEDEVRLRPVLSTQIGMAFMDEGEPEASEARLRDAEQCLNGPSDAMVVVDKEQLKTLPAMIAITRAYNAQVQGDFSASVKFAELALQHIPEDDLFRRAQATIMLEFTHWSRGDLESARSAMDDWMNSMQQAGNFAFVVASAFALADILVEQGQLRQAEKTYQQSLQLAAQHGKEAQQVTAHHHLGLAMLYHEMGKDAAAAEYLQKARELGEQTTLVDWPYRWQLAQARLKESRGDLEAALILLDEARGAYVKNPVPDTRPIDALKANVYLKQGRLAKAQDWMLARGLSADDEISYLGEFEHLTLARVLLAEYQNRQGRPSFLQAIGLLERLLKGAEAQRRTGSVIEILVAQALAHQTQGNLPLALVSLERALTLAEPEGYVRLFVDEGEPMRSLLRLLLERRKAEGGRMNEYAGKLLAAFGQQNIAADLHPFTSFRAGSSAFIPHPSIEPESRPAKNTLVESLSERELEVLRLVAQGLTNNEISQRLVLALSTVKGHNLRIFGKLQVQNRTEAVKRARELGLL